MPKFLNEKMEDIIEKAKVKDNQVENVLENQGMMDEIVVKNTDDIRVIKKEKEKNSLAIKHIEKRIDMIDEEIKMTKKTVVERANKVRDKTDVVEEVFKSVKCNVCVETYSRMIDLEIHIKNCHKEHQGYQCDHCEKRFSLKWRLRKHTRVHTRKNVLPCYYFNDNQKCPFYE